MLVFWVNTSSLLSSLEMSTSIGPTCRQATEKFEGSSLRPRGWPQPPLRAWEMWQTTPGTSGSSKSLTQTLSFGESRLKVVLMQPISSARAALIAARSSSDTIESSFMISDPFEEERRTTESRRARSDEEQGHVPRSPHGAYLGFAF